MKPKTTKNLLTAIAAAAFTILTGLITKLILQFHTDPQATTALIILLLAASIGPAILIHDLHTKPKEK